MILRLILFALLFVSFQSKHKIEPFIVVLGIAQDAGYPQIGCGKDCCKKYWDKKVGKKRVSSLALFDPAINQK